MLNSHIYSLSINSNNMSVRARKGERDFALEYYYECHHYNIIITIPEVSVHSTGYVRREKS